MPFPILLLFFSEQFENSDDDQDRATSAAARPTLVPATYGPVSARASPSLAMRVTKTRGIHEKSDRMSNQGVVLQEMEPAMVTSRTAGKRKRPDYPTDTPNNTVALKMKQLCTSIEDEYHASLTLNLLSSPRTFNGNERGYG